MIELFGAGFDDRDPSWKRQRSKTTACALALIISGKLVYRIDGVTYQLSKGDLLLIPEGRMREAFHSDQDHHQKYWATFVMDEAGAGMLPMLNQQVPIVVKTGQYEYMKQRFAQLIQQWMGKLPYYEPICAATLTDMLGRMNRELDAKQYPSPMLKMIATIQEYVLTHYREDIRVDQLAMLVSRSPNYISTLYRRLTGGSLKEYIHQVKVSAARDLLYHHQVTIGQAAEYVGFCDQAYFNRVFKKVYGFPPSILLKERNHALKPKGDR
ncbi:AraC family transcriptional regulator [Paenibacillus sp. 2TAB23]|uniref:AraC family transcriptional regulator n=1 Tax=Paenibacillus sp. 2TAB23 TaxID=3233004 RepID=UPI003F95A8EB